MNISQYRKIKVIGRGAHGLVKKTRFLQFRYNYHQFNNILINSYAILCKRVKDNAKVVIKELFSHELSEEERKASMNEIQILSMLRHPNIIAYFDSFIGDVGSVFANNNNSNNDGNSKLDASMDVGNLNTMNNIPASPVSTTSSTDATQEKALMIVMEYADGGTLYEYLQKQTGDLSEHEVLHLFCQIALALHYVHSRNVSKGVILRVAGCLTSKMTANVMHCHITQILHRDLKTTNIFISGNGVSKVLKIADFGISKVMNSNGKAETVSTDNIFNQSLR